MDVFVVVAVLNECVTSVRKSPCQPDTDTLTEAETESKSEGGTSTESSTDAHRYSQRHVVCLQTDMTTLLFEPLTGVTGEKDPDTLHEVL